MKEFMLLIRGEYPHHTTQAPETRQQFLQACQTYIEDLKRDGKLVGAQPLDRDGLMLSGSPGAWKDGPFNESKEAIIGYYHIRAADVAEATEIAKGNPEFAYSAATRIEVRPIKGSEASTGYVYPKAG